jgi:hypothetical protein
MLASIFVNFFNQPSFRQIMQSRHILMEIGPFFWTAPHSIQDGSVTAY